MAAPARGESKDTTEDDTPATLLKFPRTHHLTNTGGTAVTRDDIVKSSKDALAFLGPGLWVWLEEKIDGANLGISISKDNKVITQNRSHYVTSVTHKQFSKLDDWIKAHMADLFEILVPERHILYGEWCAYQHSVPYKKLPDWFLAFDIFDRKTGDFLSLPARNAALAKTTINVVPLVAGRRVSSVEELLPYLDTKSKYRDDDGPVEGVYLRVDQQKPIKDTLELFKSKGVEDVDAIAADPARLRALIESQGAYLSEDNTTVFRGFLKRRAKLVRPDFVQGIEEHWMSKELVKNTMAWD